ncbi:MAG: PP2C family serine/threonine-protein phosphatase [Pseudomonadota bacterium]
MSSYKIEAGTAQHIGDRAQQSDRTALFAGAQAPGYIMAVLADGLSGGAIAPEQVLHTSKQLFDDYRSSDTVNLGRIEDLLRDIVLEAHTIIKMSPIVASMEPQSTVVLLIITPQGQAVWAHVGDSRLYRFSHKDCLERSNDNEYVEHLIATDNVPPEAAKRHRSSKLLSNVLGNKFKQPYVTVGRYEGLEAGDAFLLCSDGLWQYFADKELASVIDRVAPRQAAERLIDKANERALGKGDNCTMAIVRLVKPPKEIQNYTVEKMRRAV